MLTPKRLAAAFRDRPPWTTASTTRSRRSSDSAIPAASFARRESSITTQPIRGSSLDSPRSDTALADDELLLLLHPTYRKVARKRRHCQLGGRTAIGDGLDKVRGREGQHRQVSDVALDLGLAARDLFE